MRQEADLKAVLGDDACILAEKWDYASVETEVDEIDIDELTAAAAADLSKLSNVLKSVVVKKTVW